MSAIADARTMLRRNYRHTTRNPITLFNAVIFPVVMMFLFVYVLGGGFAVGVNYIDYATPGVILMTIGYGIGPTAIGVNTDMASGFINRLRVMDVSRGAVLAAHVIASMLRSMAAIVFVFAMAFLLGLRPSASPLDWLGVLGVVLLTVFAISWLTTGLGLAAKTATSANVAIVPLVILPFLSSAFVPASKMGPGARQFAEYQPFTPIMETVRGLLLGTPIGHSAAVATTWCAGIAAVSYVWARNIFNKA